MNKPWKHLAVQIAGMAIIITVVVYFVGLLLGASMFTSWGTEQSMAVPTAVMFFIVGCAFIFIGTDDEL